MKVGGSATDVVVSVGTVRRLVATGAPTGSLHEAGSVILRGVPDRVGIDHAGSRRSLKVTAQAKIGIASDEHLRIHRAMRAVAGDAAFFHRTMLKNEWSFLGGVTLGASLILALHRRTIALDGVAGMHVVAIDAGYFSRKHRMGVGQAKFAAFLQMAGKTGFGRRAWIDDGALGAATLDVDAACAVTGFATGITNARIGECQLRVRG